MYQGAHYFWVVFLVMDQRRSPQYVKKNGSPKGTNAFLPAGTSGLLIPVVSDMTKPVLGRLCYLGWCAS